MTEKLKEEAILDSKIHSSELLTRREKDVCSLLLKGMQSKEIAFLLDISERTVYSHRNRIFKKYRVNNAVELLHECFLD